MATIQDRYFNVLMERVRTEKYPSHQMLDWIEISIATSEQLVAYVGKVGDPTVAAKSFSHASP